MSLLWLLPQVLALTLSGLLAVEEASFYVSRQPCGEAGVTELGHGSSEACQQPLEGN